ncbi:MAG: SMP-30/gluconolactonase/LRE family protein [Deltaproteobacteria bacterium]|nr:SMP-30/gluconolactonase/LRE family protein [Deltaproteobacteria bacterium]
MRRPSPTALWLGAGAALGAAMFVWVRLSEVGMLLRITPHSAWSCERIAVTPGPEDLVFDPDADALWVATFDRRVPGGAGEGRLYRYDLDRRTLEDRTPALDFPFHPHGVDLWRSPEGERVLAVVNHRSPTDHSVELFSDQGGAWALRRSVTGLRSPNDVAIAGVDRFYVTEDHRTSGALRLLEEFAAGQWSDLLMVDEGRRSVALGGLAYPNGVQLSADGATLYLTETLGRRLRALDVSPDGSLRPRWQRDLSAAPDNVEVDETGALWVAAHPKLLDFLAHASDPGARSPSSVLVYSAEGEALEERWLDDGTLLSGASTAAHRRGITAIGAVFESAFLVCR